MLSIFDSLIIPSSSCLYDVVMVFWVSHKGDLAVAVGAFEVEPKHLNA